MILYYQGLTEPEYCMKIEQSRTVRKIRDFDEQIRY